jgi:hypothetical protein
MAARRGGAKGFGPDEGQPHAPSPPHSFVLPRGVASGRLPSTGVGSDQQKSGPSLGRGETPPRFSMPQAPYAADAYRGNWEVPYGKGTIAVGTIDNDDRTIIGVNSRAAGYTTEDRAAADAMRDNLLVSDPDVMRTDNIGIMPNNAVYHAEATALIRAARMYGGSLYGRYLDIYVDRPMCGNCLEVLPIVSRELGYPTVRFTDIYGKRRTLRYSTWE